MTRLLAPRRKALLQPTWAADHRITRPRVSAQKGYIDVTVPLPGLIARDIDVDCDGARVTVRTGSRDALGRRPDVAATVRLPVRASGRPRWILRQGLLCVRLAREDEAVGESRSLADRMRDGWIALTARLSRAVRAYRLRLQNG